MYQEVFKKNFFVALILPIIIATVMLGFYFIAGDMPAWTLILLIVPAGLAIGGQTTKLIVEDDTLYYKHGFIFKKEESVSLHDVSQVVTRVVETWGTDSDGKTERSTSKITYVLDESGKTFFSFPAGLVARGNKQRFGETVTAINPNVHIS